MLTILGSAFLFLVALRIAKRPFPPTINISD